MRWWSETVVLEANMPAFFVFVEFGLGWAFGDEVGSLGTSGLAVWSWLLTHQLGISSTSCIIWMDE